MTHFAPPKAKRPAFLWTPLPATNTTATTTIATNTKIAMTNPTKTTTCKICKKWGAPCLFCAPPAPLPSPQESDWNNKDWNGNRHQAREEKMKEQLWKEEEKNGKEEVPVNYSPPSSIYDPTYKEDTLSHCDPKGKQILHPHYYPQNYKSDQREDAPIIADNLIPPTSQYV